MPYLGGMQKWMGIWMAVAAATGWGSLSGQISLPCDFESTPTTADFTDFDGGIAAVVPNPAPDAVNPSAQVAQIVRNSGALWAGSYLTLATPAEFGAEAGLRMNVWSPESDIFVRLKFESDMGFVELDAWLVEAGAWTELNWDFSNMASGVHDRLVFMFDVGTEGDGSANSTFYFDDLAWYDAEGDATQPQLPLTWDDAEVHPYAYGFAGSAAWVAADPVDASNNVLEVLKTDLALDYSGVALTNRNGLAEPIAFSSEDQTVTARVWAPDVGLPILMKLENKDDPSVFVQTLATTNIPAAWDTLTFDFAQPTEGSPAWSPTATYDLPVVFFNFGWNGALFGPLTFRIDDVATTAQPVGVVEHTGRLAHFGEGRVQLFPAPAAASPVRVYNAAGQPCLEVPGTPAVFELRGLATGVYIVQWMDAHGTPHATRTYVP